GIGNCRSPLPVRRQPSTVLSRPQVDLREHAVRLVRGVRSRRRPDDVAQEALGGFWIVERGRHRRAHQGGRTIGDRGSELEPLARVEQVIEIIGWLGAERRAERQGNGERSHRAPSSFSIALRSAFASASVARIVPVGLPFCYLVATVVLSGSAAVNHDQRNKISPAASAHPRSRLSPQLFADIFACESSPVPGLAYWRSRASRKSGESAPIET